MSERIRIGILEDQQVFRESLVALFEGAGMEVVARGANVEGFLAQLRETKPDVVLVDLRLESPDTGVSTFAFDAGGQLTQATDARGKVSGYTYDLLEIGRAHV